ncbi:unnamed protein product [Ceutorhynchus assimilis]|uniref:pH-sensitive chloride channel 2 n=1 Tax=Ceutorhynchus assimilis TaxID=467358 RepID=A0A9N9MNA5_9CUCU|nr:unnamed protein product [Ceutorhynchus assimilis]
MGAIFLFFIFLYGCVDCDIRPITVTDQTIFKRNSTENCPVLQPSLDNLSQEEFVSKLTQSCRYDQASRPPSDLPLRVNFQIDMRHIENIDNTQFKTHLLVQINFKDDRLNFAQLSPNRGAILGQESLKNKLWMPHIYVKNEKASNLMGLDRKDVFLKIDPQGDITYSYRMTTTFFCSMNLRKFPFDHQVCQLIWASWVYNDSNLELQWAKTQPYIISEHLQLTEFSLGSIAVESTKTSKFDPATISAWNLDEGYSSLIFKFQLKREAGYYILEYFLPSIFLIIMSWVSFWIQADAAPARTTLGTATMLSFITLNGNLSKSLPKVSYIKASEIWFLGGATFIFCSLAEFTFVNVIWRRKKKVELAKQSSKYIIKSALSPRLARKDLRKSESLSSLDAKNSGHYLTIHGSSNSLNVPTITTTSDDGQNPNPDSGCPTPTQQAWAEMTPQEVAIWIDRKARVVFPVLFLVYNLLYWSFVYAL